MSYDLGQQALVSRIIDATSEGIDVHILITGRDAAERVRNPISSGGVLSFDGEGGTTIRLLESSIIGIVESEQ